MEKILQSINLRKLKPKTETEKVMNNIKEKDFYCTVCQDRGVYLKNGLAHRCNCVQKKMLYKRFKTAKMDGLLLLQTFDKFQLSYYSSFIRDAEYSGKTYREIAEETFNAALKFVDEMVKNPLSKGMLLTGPVGSGKTFLAAAIANQLIAKDQEVLFLVVPDLLDALRATYDNTASNTEQQLISTAREVNTLILDDLGAHNYTDWTRNKLYSIINYRVIKMLPTIVTTNLEIEDLEKFLGERTTSRLIQLCRAYRLLVDTNIRYLQAESKN